MLQPVVWLVWCRGEVRGALGVVEEGWVVDCRVAVGVGVEVEGAEKEGLLFGCWVGMEVGVGVEAEVKVGWWLL